MLECLLEVSLVILIDSIIFEVVWLLSVILSLLDHHLDTTQEQYTSCNQLFTIFPIINIQLEPLKLYELNK